MEACNNAKLREALTEISNLADALDVNNPNVVAILDLCRDALAAQPRNCDRFATARDAREAWLNDESNWDDFGSPEKEIVEWLLAPMQKGGAV